jgi:hypothetical protein
MALILLGFEHLAGVRDREGINAMRHQNSVFHSILKHVPWGAFDRLVDQHKADFRVRSLSTKGQFIALAYGQLAGADSLREIVGGLDSHADRLYHLGGETVSRTTLADANAKRPAAVFSGLFEILAGRADRHFRQDAREAVRLIDATSIKLSGAASQWARFSAKLNAVKAHVVLDPDADRPVYLQVTAANVNDITPAKAMPIDPMASYVFDLGYYDFAWWAKLDQAGCRFVTRLKSNTKITDVRSLPLHADAPHILSDQIGLLPQRLSKSRNNPFSDPVRVLQVRIDSGEVLRVVSNDLDAPASEIAALYKRRWLVELFFRWIKQTLKITHLVGRSENAARIQIAVALIVYLLLRLAQATQTDIRSPLAFARLVRTTLFHHRPIHQLIRPPNPTKKDPNQMTLHFPGFAHA